MESLVVYIEVFHSCDPNFLSQQIIANIKNTFEISAKVEILERGTLANEFESSVKAPRFVDKRN